MKSAFVFPGQGSQRIGMLAEFTKHAIVLETYAEASDVLGYDLWKLTSSGDPEQLNQTEYAQPALLVASVALWRLWHAIGGATPAIVAGHSLGEFSALTCAGVLTLQDAVTIVAKRGQLMQHAIAPGVGAMAAIIGLQAEQVAKVCQQAAHDQVLAAANYNSSQQIVISGETAAVHRGIQLALENGAKLAKLIPVSVPSHCALMQPAADKLEQFLNKFNFSEPALSVVNNVAASSETDPARIKAALCQQLCAPVRWVDCVAVLLQQQVEAIYECGPGQVLTKLAKREVAGVACLAMEVPATLQQLFNQQ